MVLKECAFRVTADEDTSAVEVGSTLETKTMESSIRLGQGGRNLEHRLNPAVKFISVQFPRRSTDTVVLGSAQRTKPLLPKRGQFDLNSAAIVLCPSTPYQPRVDHGIDELAYRGSGNSEEVSDLTGTLGTVVAQQAKNLRLRAGKRFFDCRRNRAAFQNPLDGPRDHQERLE